MTGTPRWMLLTAVAGLLLAVALPTAAQAQEAPPAGQPPEAAPAADSATAADAGQPQPEAQDATEGDEADTKASDDLAEQQERKRDFIRTIFSWGMVPIWACSVILVALVFERRKALKPAKIIDPEMIERVADLVGGLKIDEARQASEASDTVIGRAWAQGLHEVLLSDESIGEALTDATVLAMKPLKRNLQALATLGVVSPLLGLLGTIVGMIIIFTQIAATGGADKAQLAGGIGLALFTTAGGLIVAIPAILSNRYFTARLTGIAEQAEEAINRIGYRYRHALAESKADGGDKAGN